MIEPLNGFVVLEKIETQNTTSGGLILSAKQNEVTKEGKVISVSKDVTEINRNNRVVYMNGKGIDVKIDGENYLMIHSTSIIAIVRSGT